MRAHRRRSVEVERGPLSGGELNAAVPGALLGIYTESPSREPSSTSTFHHGNVLVKRTDGENPSVQPTDAGNSRQRHLGEGAGALARRRRGRTQMVGVWRVTGPGRQIEPPRGRPLLVGGSRPRRASRGARPETGSPSSLVCVAASRGVHRAVRQPRTCNPARRWPTQRSDTTSASAYSQLPGVSVRNFASSRGAETEAESMRIGVIAATWTRVVRVVKRTFRPPARPIGDRR